MGEGEERRERRERWLQTLAFFGALLVLAVVLYLAFVVQSNAPQEPKPTTALPIPPTTWIVPTRLLVPTPAATSYPRPPATAPAGPASAPYPVLIAGPYFRLLTTTAGTPMLGQDLATPGPVGLSYPGIGVPPACWWAVVPRGSLTPTPSPVSAEGPMP